MATSSSDESCTAPKLYNLSSSLDSASRLSPNKKKCRLCNNFSKTFHCRDCVYSGSFYHSNSKSTDSFADNQAIIYVLQERIQAAGEECCDFIAPAARADELRTKIRQSKDKIRIMKLLIEEKKEKRERQQKKHKECKDKINEYCHCLPRYDQKVNQYKDLVDFQSERNEKNRILLNKRKMITKQMAKARMEQLLKYIFIIEKVDFKQTESSESDSLKSALADASRTTYSSERWEFGDYSDGLHYRMCGPTLPISGNYAAYNIWADKLTNESNENVDDRNPACTISAALTYVAQLVLVIAYYLNIRLPHEMNFSNYQNPTMEEKQFAHRVACLNANILYLCFTQNVDLNTLHPNETIHNLLQLMNVNNDHLGRDGPLEVNAVLAKALEEPLHSDLNYNDSSSSEESFPIEWETVPHVPYPEASPGPASIQSVQMITTQQASSVAGGLVNSAAASIVSLWRGFTGTR